MLSFEKSFIAELPLVKEGGSCNNCFVIGVDEVGRGCLAGPVVAAAVAINPNFDFTNKVIPKIDDSKKLSALQRQKAESFIKQHFVYAVAMVSSQKIDEINILNASLKAMEDACNELNFKENQVLKTFVDGNILPNLKPFFNPVSVIKGDSKSFAIACASIIAKEFRDNFMKNLALSLPYYDFENNKGYGTKKHKQAILQHGYSSYHRKSFKVTF